MTAPASWIADEDAPSCLNCHQAFDFLHRRHHCRSCGRVLCNACSQWRIELKQGESKQRVCYRCNQYVSNKIFWETIGRPTLQKGALFSIHDGTNNPKAKYVKLCNDDDRLEWSESGKSAGRNDYISLASLTDILIGQKTDAFRKCIDVKNETLCFSAVTPRKTLDVQAQTSQLRDLWAQVLGNRVTFRSLEKPNSMNEKEAERIEQNRQTCEKRAAQAERRAQRNAIAKKYKLKR